MGATALRVRRRYTGTFTMEMMKIRMGMLGPTAATMPSASSRVGKAWNDSEMRSSTESNRPPPLMCAAANTDSAPRGMPTTTASAAALKPTPRSSCAP